MLAMFDRVAPRNDLLNLVMTGGVVPRWRRAATCALAPSPGEVVLNVATGTGASTAPIKRSGASVVACDPSLGMLAEGSRRNLDLCFVEADALNLPFPDINDQR